MKTDTFRFLPEARRERIVIKEFEGEVLVYDLDRDQAHCLNPLAGSIWRHCDGRTTAREIAASLSHAQGSTVDENVVWLGLEELRRSHLLEESGDKVPCRAAMSMSRREAVRRMGLGAAIALPLVASMGVPTAVEAAVSCRASCQPCSTSTQCCSGACFPGACPANPGTRCA